MTRWLTVPCKTHHIPLISPWPPLTGGPAETRPLDVPRAILEVVVKGGTYVATEWNRTGYFVCRTRADRA